MACSMLLPRSAHQAVRLPYVFSDDLVDEASQIVLCAGSGRKQYEDCQGRHGILGHRLAAKRSAGWEAAAIGEYDKRR